MVTWSWTDPRGTYDSGLHRDDRHCTTCCVPHGYPRPCLRCGGLLHGEAMGVGRDTAREHSTHCATCDGAR